jgi:molybdopterin-containing oxidoreductase family iron-sulfur binding subunit
MQVGLNAYALYKGFNDVQSVTLVKADTDDHLRVFRVKKLMGRGDIIKRDIFRDIQY